VVYARLRVRVLSLAPFTALLLLIVLPSIGSQSALERAAIRKRNEAVARAFDAVPYQIEDWVGEDSRMPAAALEILRPNAMLSRSYTHQGTGITAKLLVVHCADARDMLGHYPPLCYPAAGWDADSLAPLESIDIAVGDEPFEIAAYRFRRLDQQGVERLLTVYGYFILPDGTTTTDVGGLQQQTDHIAWSRLGAAQVQVTISGNLSPKKHIRQVEELLNGVADLLRFLGQGD
jgi:hypothetical protein